jgi:hypothetical protein
VFEASSSPVAEPAFEFLLMMPLPAEKFVNHRNADGRAEQLRQFRAPHFLPIPAFISVFVSFWATESMAENRSICNSTIMNKCIANLKRAAGGDLLLYALKGLSIGASLLLLALRTLGLQRHQASQKKTRDQIQICKIWSGAIPFATFAAFCLSFWGP